MAYRAYFALPVENFATTTGQHTNAVYGFTSMLINLLRDEEPTHVAVAFDAGRTTFRTERYAEYKGTRDETPEPFRGQVPLIKEILAAMGTVTLEKEGFEADDILASLADEAARAGMDVLICSGDRDTFQLVGPDVTVLYPRKGVSDLVRMTPSAVEEKYGVGPAHYPDLAALVGETSDNLPGVPGVGPKTAAKWITTYGDLDGVIAHVGEIRGRVGDNLRAHLDQVILNRSINRLLTDVELPVDVAGLQRGPLPREDVHRVFDSLEFRTLRDRLFALAPSQETVNEPESGFALVVDAVAPGGVGPWLERRQGRLLGVDVHGADAPPTSRGGLGDASAGDAWTIAIADDAGSAVTIDLAEITPRDEHALAAWLADDGAPKALHDAKVAWHRLAGRGLTLNGIVFDTALAAYLCHPDQRGYALADLSIRYLHRELRADEDSSGQGMLALDGDEEGQRAGLRAAAVRELADAIGADLAVREATALLSDVELPVLRVLARMERDGIAADLEYFQGIERLFSAAVDDAAAGAYQVIGREVNLSSPKQLQEVLFDQLGMPRTKKIKTGYTTDAEALAELYVRTSHPFLQFLLAHRDAIRLRQTVEGLLRSIAPDGRIHTTFQQTIAATGRLSSTDPNLQNIPIRTEEGQRIRQGFVVGPGYETLLTADYSQIEMRIMAHLSGDAGLIEAFHSGEDLHSYVGARVFGVPTGEVTGAMRSKIKAMSYGLAYGLSAFGLSRQLGIDTGEARALMDDYFERFGGVRDYLAGVVEEARRTGYTETLLGRRRYLPDLTSDNRQRREMAERMALNAPIQGSAADLIKVAMIGVQAQLKATGLKSRLVLQVHDELVLEVAPGEVTAAEAVVREQMGKAADLKVPLDVTIGTGDNWRTAGH
jgi:DNA polymerase-1